MIKLTIGDLLSAQPVLEKLVALAEEEKMPFSGTFKLRKLLKLANVEINEFHSERIALVKRLGVEKVETKDLPDGTKEIIGSGEYEISEEKKDVFFKELNKILSLQVEFTTPKFTPDDFGLINMKLSDLTLIEKFMESEQEEPRKSFKLKLAELEA